MTGPEHYVEADGHLSLAYDADQEGDFVRAERHLRFAEVNATLALAAATAEPIAQAYDGPDDTTIPMAWSKAIS